MKSNSIHRQERRQKGNPKKQTSKFIFGYIFVGLLVIILPLIFSTHTLDPILMTRLFALNFIILVSTPLIIRNKFFSINPGIFIPIIAYLLITTISLFYAFNFKEGLYDVAKTTSFLWVLLLLVITFKKHESVFYSLPFFISLAAIIALIIGFQDLTTANSIFQNSFLTDGRPAIYAVSGLMAHKNQYAISLMLMLPFTVFGIYKYKSYKKYLAVGVTILLLLMIVMLKTRSVWVGISGGLLTGLVLAFIFYKNLNLSSQQIKKLALTSIAGLTIISTTIFFSGNNSNSKPSIIKDLFDTHSATNINRLKIWTVSYDMICDNPLFGVGSGNWKIKSPEYFSAVHFDRDLLNWLRPHNDYLWVWSEKGIMGLLSFLSIFGVAIFFGIKILQSDTVNSKDKIFSLLLLSGLISYMLVSLFTFPLERINQQVYLALILASIAAIYKFSKGGLKINIQKWIIIALISTTSLLSIIYSSSAINQEKKIKETRIYQAQKNWPAMLNSALSIPSLFKTIDIEGMPVKWYAALAYQEMNKFKDAVTHYEKALEAHPNKAKILNNLGYCYVELKNYDASITCLEKAVNIQNHYPEALLNLSTSWYRKGNYNKCYQTLVRIPEYERDERLTNYISSVTRKQTLLNKEQWFMGSETFTGNYISKCSHVIQNSPAWYQQIIEKSEKEYKTIEEVLYWDACYAAENNGFEKYLTWVGAQHFLSLVNNDSIWKKQITASAKQKGKSLEAELLDNAVYMFRTKYPEIFEKNTMINKYKDEILRDEEWRTKLEMQAAINNIETSDLIDATAGFLAEANINGLDDFEKKVADIVTQIQNNPDWLLSIKTKAQTLNKPLKDVMRKDAVYLLERQEK